MSGRFVLWPISLQAEWNHLHLLQDSSIKVLNVLCSSCSIYGGRYHLRCTCQASFVCVGSGECGLQALDLVCRNELWMGYVCLWLNPHWRGILQQDAGYFILGSCRESGEVSSVPQTIRFSLQNAPCQGICLLYLKSKPRPWSLILWRISYILLLPPACGMFYPGTGFFIKSAHCLPSKKISQVPPSRFLECLPDNLDILVQHV